MASTTVNFNLKTAGYVNYANQTLTFRLLTAGAEASTGDESYLVLPGIVTATSAANGDGSVTLFRNGKSAIDSVYEVILPNREKAQFIIPSGVGTVELSNLLVNSQPSGANTQQSSVYAQAIQRANHTGTQLLSTLSDAATVQLKPSEGAFANGDKTKLDAIEASADVTDTANVTSAGALMDSEVDADIKTLSLPASTTISTFAKTFLDDADAAAVKSTLGIADAASVSNFVPRSITFTNTSAFLSLADNAALNVGTGDFSLSFWARLDALPSDGIEPVLTKLSGTGYRLKFSSGSLILTMQDPAGTANFTLATGLNDNKWHVYVVTVDRNGNVIAYVDNVAQGGVTASAAGSLDNGGQFQIGSDGGSNAGDGIALGNYIALHKSALSASQASEIFFSADAALTLDSAAPTLMVDLRKSDKTFTDVSASGLAVTTNGAIIFNEGRITSLSGVGDINCSSISADVAATGLNVIFDGTDTGDNKITLTDNLASALDITESTNSYLKFTTTNSGEKVVIGKALDISGATTAADVTGTNVLATTTLGYKAGSGGTQTQGTSKSTTVVLNKATGQITLHGAALGANTNVAFALTNSTIAANDILVFNHVSGGTIGAYNFNAVAGSGTATVTVRNITGSSLTETPVISFAVIKAVTS